MNQTVRRALRGLTLVAALAVMAAGVAQANSMKKQNLLELMQATDSIVVGTVTRKTDGFQQGLPYTEITLEVGQSVKSNHGPSYTFRQFGLIEPRSMGNGKVNLMVTPEGWPTYTEGEHVMLFLHAPASETGFQTTAGLVQGKFAIRGDRIANGTGNDALFDGVQINRKLKPELQALVNQPAGSYPAEDFLSLVRTAVEENWIENGVMTHED